MKTYGEIIAEEWDRASTLSNYGHAPLAVGWWRGRAFVRMWDYKRGAMTWREFRTQRRECKPPTDSIFNSSALARMLLR
jgi:hypothetical protein